MVLQIERATSVDAWLQSADVIRPDGAVMSWVNEDHPGYVYPEIAGYMLTYLAQRGDATLGSRDRVAGRLLVDISSRGGVGRHGIDYAFDSAMVLTGLLAHQATGGRLPDESMLHRLHDFIVDNLARRSGMAGHPTSADGHWSLSYGCHLLKCVIALSAYGDRFPERRATALVERLLDDLLPLGEGGRFRVNAGNPVSYMHAHCYAVEGMLVLDARGRGGLRPLIRASADWLAEVQLPDGGMPSSHDGERPLGPPHADCTAQAVRIWASVDPIAYRASIQRALDFLVGLAAGGGVRYRADSDDVNTWATLFTAQAVEWASHGAAPRWMV